mgnify:CR=1 FL=1
MMGQRRIGAMVSVLAVLAVAACTDDSGVGMPPHPGTLTARLITPHDDDGAFTFELTGPTVESPTAADGSLRLFVRRVDASTVRGAVIGTLTDGAVVTLHIPDVGAAADYSARVLEVADRGNALRSSLAGYALVLEPN